MVGTVRRTVDLPASGTRSADHVVALDSSDPASELRHLVPGGFDRIVEVAFSDNADLDAAVAKVGTVIAAYATREDRPAFPFWPMLFDNITIRLLGSDDFPVIAKQQAATDLIEAARDGALFVSVDEPVPLHRIAAAHERVDASARRRILVEVDR